MAGILLWVSWLGKSGGTSGCFCDGFMGFVGLHGVRVCLLRGVGIRRIVVDVLPIIVVLLKSAKFSDHVVESCVSCVLR